MKCSDSELEDGEEIEDDCINDLNADDWDDTALIEAWDMAKNEYLRHHALESQDSNPIKKQKIQEPIQEIIESEILSESLMERPDQTETDQPKSMADVKKKSNNSLDGKANDKNESDAADQVEDSTESPISNDQLNALMAWYWAGYYTAKLNKC